jgi:short-subunit dehydrogenase
VVTGRSLAGLRCLVTGASGGIGRAIATRLLAEEAVVCLAGRDGAALEEVSSAAADAPWIARDLTAPDVATACAEVVAMAEARVGAVDVLVSNAGEGWAGPMTEMPIAAVDRLLAVDLAVPVHLARILAPPMVERGRGSLVFIGSIAGRVGVPGESVYAAAKGGLALFASSLRAELEPAGVGVSLVTPGAVATQFFDRRGSPYDRRFPRLVRPEQVAAAVVACLQHDRAETFTPSWLTVAPRVRGAAPRLYDRLARRFS